MPRAMRTAIYSRPDNDWRNDPPRNRDIIVRKLRPRVSRVLAMVRICIYVSTPRRRDVIFSRQKPQFLERAVNGRLKGINRTVRVGSIVP